MARKCRVITLDSTSLRTPYDAASEKSINFIGKRIAEARTKYGLSLINFSKVLADYGVNISAAGISKWEVGGSVPSAYQLLAVARALDIDSSMDYFTSNGKQPELSAEGQRKVLDYRSDLIASGKYRPLHIENSVKYIEMPVSYLSVSAGTGAFLDEGNFEMVSFPAASVPHGAEFGIRVSGNSMEPVYHDGQIVWVQKCSQINPGEVGIFVYDGEGYIKVYNEQKPEDAATYTDSYGKLHMQPVLISYNKEYEPKPISPNASFEVVGRVVQ